MRRFKIAFFETPFYLCVLHIYHVTRVATLSVRILEVPWIDRRLQNGHPRRFVVAVVNSFFWRYRSIRRMRVAQQYVLTCLLSSKYYFSGNSVV